MDLLAKNEKELLEIQVKEISDSLVTKLVLARKDKSMTQQDVADLTGMKRSNISRIERGKYTPTIDVLVKYAACLGMDIELVLKSK